jgi:hypothetical protein
MTRQGKGTYLNLGLCEQRRNLLNQAKCSLIDPDEYCLLAVSSRRLVRADEPKAELRGLLDPVTNERFFTEEERLFRS